MRSKFEISWVDDQLTQGEDIQAIVSELAHVKTPSKEGKFDVGAGKYPFLIFFYTNKEEEVKQKKKDTNDNGKSKDRKKEDPPLTKQAEQSREISDDVFNNAKNYRIYILAKFFNCISVDTTAASSSDNPVMSTEKAPVVALADCEGEISFLFSGSAVHYAKTSSSMLSLLERYYPGIGSLILVLEKMLPADYDKEERKMIEAQERLDVLRKKKEPEKDLIERCEAAIKEAESRIRELDSKQQELVDRFIKDLEGRESGALQ